MEITGPVAVPRVMSSGRRSSVGSTSFNTDTVGPLASVISMLISAPGKRVGSTVFSTETAGPLQFHSEYAIHNMNSDTSADSFVVGFPAGTAFANAGFTDIDHHSNEPYDTSDWTIATDSPNGTITWSAVDMDEDTNALRWGTTFSFWFDSDRPPTLATHQLHLFKIDEMLDVPFPILDIDIFNDGFETGDTSAWSFVFP